MKKEIPLDLSYPRELSIFEEFLKRRRETINKDFEFISSKYSIPIETLETIKNNIRQILGSESIEYFSTTVHLRPRAIDYLLLGEKRIDQAVGGENKIFHYPVYYQNFTTEGPDLIYLGSYKFSLCEIIPGFSEKRKEFKTSLDFHNDLLEYLSTEENWKEEIKINLKKLINREFSNYKENFRNLIYEYIYNIVVSILDDYKNFFERSKINKITSEIFDINQKLAEMLLKNFETLKPLLEEVGITREDLEDIKEKRVTTISTEFIIAICILGNLVHLGAEYGKFNKIRSKIGLKELDEPEKPQERFRFFEIESTSKAESDTLRFLFGTPDVDSFIYTAKYAGLKESVWSPTNQETRKRMRVVDFYISLNKIKEFIEDFNFPKEKFLRLLEELDYFAYLNEKEKEQVKNILDGLIDDGKKLKTWIDSYNNKLKEQQISNKRLHIWPEALQKSLLVFIFENYVKGKFRIIRELLSSEIFEKINGFIVEKLPESPEDFSFYGIKLPIQLPNLTKENLVNLVALLEIQQKNFDKKTTFEIFPRSILK